MFGWKLCCWGLLISVLVLASLLGNTATICVGSSDSVDSITFTSGVTLYYPLNKTYSTETLTLNLTAKVALGVNTKITWSVDNKHYGTVPWVPMFPDEMHVINKVKANLTLPQLTPGPHNLTLTVICSLRNNPSPINRCPFLPSCQNYTNNKATWTDTIQFTVKTAEQQIPEFFSITTVVMVGAVMMLAAIKYQKKLKKWVC